jgi:biotin synthase
MSANLIDAKNSRRIAALGEQVLAGHALSPDEGRWLFDLREPADIFDLLAWANRIRIQSHGDRIRLCSIVNAKAGGCSEDCRFCAQSAAYATASPRHEFIDTETVLGAAREAHQQGVPALGIVAAWKGLKHGPLLDEVCDRFQQLAQSGLVRPDASLGIVPDLEIAQRLCAAGVRVYNHNLETSRRFFPQICSTHGYDDRLATLRHLRAAGIQLCVGGIIGMGETIQDRCDLAFTLRELDVEIVPLNFLNPIPETPLAHLPPLPPLEILQTIACFRFILPKPQILLAGGRTVNLRDLQSLAFPAGASALMVGNYLTTLNQPIEKDRQMLTDLGLQCRVTS